VRETKESESEYHYGCSTARGSLERERNSYYNYYRTGM
jgi:hypothetical protein